MGCGAIVFLVLSAMAFRQAPGSVTLTYFRGIPNTTGQYIALEWQTVSEQDFAKFYIQRSLQFSNGFERMINTDGVEIDFPCEACAPGEGSKYSYDDYEVELGMVYYYKLEMVSNGGVSEFEGPITVWYGLNSPTPTMTSPLPATNTPTPTATLNATRTMTPTPTLTQPVSGPTSTPTTTPTATTTPTTTSTSLVPNVTSTPTPSRTRTRTPQIPVNTLPATGVQTLTLTVTATATTESSPTTTPTTTLMPLPSLTLLFPARSATPTITVTSTSTVTPTQPSPTPPQRQKMIIPMQVSFLGVVIALVWGCLGLFLVIFIRRASRS